MRARSPGVPEPLHAAGVTRRELEVLGLVADRLRNREIAQRLFVSERTVESHVSSLLAKLDAPDRQALSALGARLRDRTTSGGSLPEPLSSFVGRAREIEELVRLTGSHRLVTLTGPAGSGKTRLALEVGATADSLPPPVLVDLAVLPPGSEVERSFGVALGITAEESRLRDALRELVAGQSYWLLADNCEHVAESTARLLADLLASAPQLRVLATSQAPLGVAGEVVYRVLPLPLPPENDEPSAILAAAAGRLFAERAATGAPGFAVTAENARDVAGICRRLDGLPLAIELAAARVRVFSPRELLAHLDERFELLTAGVKAAGTRHLSLEAALRWSYELLDDDERLLLERCSVFPAEFDYDTVAAVVAYEPLARADVVRLFPRLLDRSLISAIHRGPSTDYRMLDSIRQFAGDRLAARGELERAQAQHARHHLAHGGSLRADLQGRDQPAALRWFDSRWPDIRAAMGWAMTHDETELAWRFLTGIGMGWDTLGIRGELFDWLDVLLDQPLPSGPLGVRAADTAAFVLWYQDLERSLRLAEWANEQAEQEDAWHRALARMVFGRASMAGRNDAAIRKLEMAAAEFRRLNDDWHYAIALELLSDAVPDAAATLARLTEAADLFGRVGDRVLRANCLNQMAQRSIEMDDNLDAAEAWLAEAYELAELTGNHHERLHAELFRARLEEQRGDTTSIGPRCLELLAEFRRIGDLRCVSRCLYALGSSALASGNPSAARRHLIESIEIADRTGARITLPAGLRLLAQLEYRAGGSQNAARLLGAADAAAARLDPARRAALPSDVELRSALRAELGPDASASAMAEGHELPVSQLLALAKR